MTTTTRPTPTPVEPAPTTPSQWSIFRTIWGRATADKTTIIGVLAFYALAFGAGIGALWLALEDVFADIDLPSAFDTILGGAPINTPAGWINGEMLSIVGPGFLIATALISASAATAGEEQRRTLGLVLATGATRTTFLAAKTAAVLTHVAIVALAMFLGMLAGNAIGSMGLPVRDLAIASAWMVPIALLYGVTALTVGALTGDTKVTMAVTAGIAAVSLVASLFLPLVESLSDVAKINLWYPYSGNVAIVDGWDWGLAAITISITLVVSAAGLIGFGRRKDLRG